MPYASRDEVSLFYEQEGSGEPPFVFVHGWCCDHTFFGPQFDHFKASHAVTALDLRGCGKSEQPEDGYDIPMLTDDVAWLCGELGISRPIVVGHSLGGMIAIDLAARHPAVPLAIAAVDPGPINPTPGTRQVFEDLSAQLGSPGGEAARRAYVELVAERTADRALRDWIVDTMCAVPLLVLRSNTEGSNVPERLLPLKPDLHFGVTVGAGHFHQLEVPEQVTAMMERFVQLATAA
jgi:pimeloyl-ACP methyl ester carboxylesterase